MLAGLKEQQRGPCCGRRLTERTSQVETRGRGSSQTQIGGWREVGFPGGSVIKSLPANAGDPGDAGLTLGVGRSPRVGNGNSPQ